MSSGYLNIMPDGNNYISSGTNSISMLIRNLLPFRKEEWVTAIGTGLGRVWNQAAWLTGAQTKTSGTTNYSKFKINNTPQGPPPQNYQGPPQNYQGLPQTAGKKNKIKKQTKKPVTKTKGIKKTKIKKDSKKSKPKPKPKSKK